VADNDATVCTQTPRKLHRHVQESLYLFIRVFSLRAERDQRRAGWTEIDVYNFKTAVLTNSKIIDWVFLTVQ